MNIQTKRLLLRQFKGADLKPYHAITSDQETMRFLGGVYDAETNFRHMAFLAGHWALRGYGYYAVELKETGEFIGRVGVAYPDGWPDIELGWTISKSHWGKGYALEAAKASLGAARSLVPQDYVIHLVHPENSASVRVAEKLGAVLDREIEFKGHKILVYKSTFPIADR